MSSRFFLFSSLSIHFYMPLHFPIYFQVISIPSDDFPYLSILQEHHSFCRSFPLFPLISLPMPILSSPFSLTCTMSPSPTQMSDHSGVFCLLCHHIFHTGPSLNWTCIIISYHVEYLITVRDERCPPPVLSRRHTHVDKPWSQNTLNCGPVVQVSKLTAASVLIFTPHVCSKLGKRWG